MNCDQCARPVVEVVHEASGKMFEVDPELIEGLVPKPGLTRTPRGWKGLLVPTGDTDDEGRAVVKNVKAFDPAAAPVVGDIVAGHVALVSVCEQDPRVCPFKPTPPKFEAMTKRQAATWAQQQARQAAANDATRRALADLGKVRDRAVNPITQEDLDAPADR